MHKTFVQAFAVNASAAFVYKIALLLHQIFLYTAITHHTYGQQSSLFAVLYLLIALTNFGFDETLLPFFSIYNQSKRQFKQLLVDFYLHAATMATIAILFFIIISYSSGEFLHNIQTYYNKNLIFILTFLFFTESIKKSVIAMMQLAFFNKEIAYAQICTLMIYIICVWSLYSLYGQLTLHLIFMPMLATSVIELSYLLYNFAQFYDRLPDAQETDAPTIHFKVLFMLRLFNYINQIAKVFYSPNSMTIYFAYALGFTQAATIKFFTNIITLCYTCIAKTVGVTSGAIFSSSKPVEMTHIFKDITHRYFQFLSILSCVMFIIVSYAYYTSMITQVMAWQILFFFSISFLEHVTITYEQLLMSQSKAWILTCMHGLGLLVLLICGYGYNQSLIDWHTVLAIFICIKTASLSFLILLVSKSLNEGASIK